MSAQWTTGITTAQELASAMAFGKMLYRDPTFWKGNNSTGVYNNSGNGMVTVTRQQDTSAPNDSKYVLKIQTNGTASPGNGGFYFGTACSSRKVLGPPVSSPKFPPDAISVGPPTTLVRRFEPLAYLHGRNRRLERVCIQGRMRHLKLLQYPFFLY